MWPLVGKLSPRSVECFLESAQFSDFSGRTVFAHRCGILCRFTAQVKTEASLEMIMQSNETLQLSGCVNKHKCVQTFHNRCSIIQEMSNCYTLLCTLAVQPISMWPYSPDPDGFFLASSFPLTNFCLKITNTKTN